MEESTWKNIFENELEDQGINHVWSLCVDEHLKAQQGYLQYTQCTFARFHCSHCSRWWNSAQVHILFLIKSDRRSRGGAVKMRIFKQECRRCNVSILQKPEITHENMKRVISNLVSKIQSMTYGQNNKNPPLNPIIYSNDVEGPHEKKHCEACKLKVCPWNIEHGEKIMVANPQPAKLHPWASSGVQQQDKRSSFATYTSIPSSPSRAVHELPHDTVVTFVIIIFIIFFLLLISNTKQ
ncbi:receptor-transporting protein 3-like [Leptodactylus fuscus]|uniref:receptor-transporting protein 3-like n=1 Tax=Leptodactylus fuscus TaxID=238119 RepID=UPI003F4ED4AB